MKKITKRLLPLISQIALLELANGSPLHAGNMDYRPLLLGGIVGLGVNYAGVIVCGNYDIWNTKIRRYSNEPQTVLYERLANCYTFKQFNKNHPWYALTTIGGCVGIAALVGWRCSRLS